MVYLTIFKVLLAKWQINLSSTNISPLNRFDSTGILQDNWIICNFAAKKT